MNAGDVMICIIAERPGVGRAVDERQIDRLQLITAIVVERPLPTERIGDRVDAIAAIVSEGQRATGRVRDAGHIVAAVMRNRDLVAVLIGDRVAVAAGREVADGLIRSGQRKGVVYILNKAVVDAGGRTEDIGAVVGEGVGEIIAPVDRLVVGAIPVGRRRQIEIKAEGPLLTQFTVMVPLGVMGEGQSKRQSAALGPGDEGDGRELVAVAGIDASYRSLPGKRGAGRSGNRLLVKIPDLLSHQALHLGRTQRTHSHRPNRRLMGEGGDGSGKDKGPQE